LGSYTSDRGFGVKFETLITKANVADVLYVLVYAAMRSNAAVDLSSTDTFREKFSVEEGNE
jgi:hypothetical protein